MAHVFALTSLDVGVESTACSDTVTQLLALDGIIAVQSVTTECRHMQHVHMNDNHSQDKIAILLSWNLKGLEDKRMPVWDGSIVGNFAVLLVGRCSSYSGPMLSPAV